MKTLWLKLLLIKRLVIITIILIFVSVKANAQTGDSLGCQNLIKRIEDKVMGTSFMACKIPLVVSKDGINGFKILSNTGNTGERTLIIIAVGAGYCIDQGQKANILFRDGTRLELHSDSKFNCEGEFVIYFGGVFGKSEEYDLLSSKEIETLRVWTSKGFVEQDFTPDNSKRLMKTLDCLKGF